MAQSEFLAGRHLFSEWITRLLEDAKYEESQHGLRILQAPFRKFIWRMCYKFECMDKGLPGQVCRLFETYLFKMLHIPGVDTEARKDAILNDLPLLLASCILLAAKMKAYDTPVSTKLITQFYLSKNIPCSAKQLTAKEFHVYRTLEFRLPLWSNVDIGEMLAVEMKFPRGIIRKVAETVDFADYNRPAIVRTLAMADKKNANPSNGEYVILSLDLTAGAVAAVAALCNCNSNHIVRQLAGLVNAPEPYIRCLQKYHERGCTQYVVNQQFKETMIVNKSTLEDQDLTKSMEV